MKRMDDLDVRKFFASPRHAYFFRVNDVAQMKIEQRWSELRNRIEAHGLRNSLMIAIAPTATIASIAGCYECIEPQVSNLFKRETLSGEFMQINRYLVNELQSRGLWDAQMIADVIPGGD